MNVQAAPGAPDAPAGPVPASDVSPAAGATWTDADGRVYTVSTDPATGDTLLDHHSTPPTGNPDVSATLDIRIRIRRDGTGATRSVHQHVQATSGDMRDTTTVTDIGSDGVVRGEVEDSSSSIGGKQATDHTVTTFTAGKPTARTTHQVEHDVQTSPTTGESVDVTQAVDAVWDEHGAPITDTTVPHIDLHETVRYTTPHEGINKDTNRILTTERHATGTPTAVTWPDPMKLTVRFEGHGDQYIERVLTMKLGADGQPDPSVPPTIVSTEDHQSTLVKAMTQARVWSGSGSMILADAGLVLLGMKPKLGRGLLWTAFGISLAGIGAHTQAFATKRNDFDTGWLAMNVYDAAWVGLSAIFSGRAAGASPAVKAAMYGAGAIGTGMSVQSGISHSSDLGSMLASATDDATAQLHLPQISTMPKMGSSSLGNIEPLSSRDVSRVISLAAA